MGKRGGWRVEDEGIVVDWGTVGGDMVDGNRMGTMTWVADCEDKECVGMFENVGEVRVSKGDSYECGNEWGSHLLKGLLFW